MQVGASCGQGEGGLGHNWAGWGEELELGRACAHLAALMELLWLEAPSLFSLL